MAVFRCSHVLLACLTITAVFSQQQIVSVDEIEDGGTFSITCDASRMTNIASTVNNIASLGIRLRTSQTLPNAATNGLLAQYKSYGTVTQIQYVPSGRSWTVSFTGVNGGTNNRNTMKIVVLVSDAKCIDAGLYICDVGYEDSIGATQEVSSTKNVTAKAAVQAITLEADDYFPVLGRPNYSEYEEGDNITLTCRIDGPKELEMMWKTGTYDSFSGFTTSDYPYDNDITTSDPTLISSGACNTYEHRSVLNLRSLSQDVNDQVMYLCVVMESDQFGAAEVARANLTIGITSKTTTPNPGPAVTSDKGTGSFTITITVDADSVTIPEDGITDIVALTLNRRTTQDQDFQLVAQYKAYGSQQEVTNIPAGRDWTVTFSGANGGTNNRNTMKMEVVIRDAQSSDAGLYQIIVRYTRPHDGAEVDVSVTRSLTSNGEPQDEDEDDDNNIGAIIGGSIAGCIVIIIVVVVVIYVVRRQGVSTKDPPKSARTDNVDKDAGYESISGTIDSGQSNERVLNSDVMHGTVQYINQLS